MLASITPVGEQSRRQRWPITATAYLIGSALGGAVIGAALGSVGHLIDAAAAGALTRLGLPVLALLAIAGGVAEDRGVTPPGPRRQVDERWLATYRGWVYGLGFGFQLGAGLVTRVVTVAVHLTMAAALLSGSSLHGLAIGLTFGAVRSAPVLAAARVRTPRTLRQFHERLARSAVPAARAAGGAQVAVGLVAVVSMSAGLR